MADSLRDLLLGGFGRRELVEAVVPRRTFDDVVLPPATRRALGFALSLIQHHELIYERWGLAERHGGGLGLAFHFAGAPGTGKTICAEAIANALGKRLLVVRYSELESMWAGQTAKHIVEVFRAAERQDAVLFFDEADAVAGRRFAGVERGYEREANAVVNVLLHELEQFPGVIIFATNLAANIDPAFERRILTHILFERPTAEERERIWRVQFHPAKTPLADDVDFRALAERYDASGGEIRNAALKAAQMAAAQPGPDDRKRIEQEHLVKGMEEVLASAAVMDQSLYGPGQMDPAMAMVEAHERLAGGQHQLRDDVEAIAARVEGLEHATDRAIGRLDELHDILRERPAARSSGAVAAIGAGPGRAVVLLAAFAVLVAITALAALVVVLGRG